MEICQHCGATITEDDYRPLWWDEENSFLCPDGGAHEPTDQPT